MSANQARKTVQNFRAQGTYNNSNKRGGVAAAMQKKWRIPLEAPSCTRVVRWPNDVARSSSRLNNSKVSLQSDVENARPSTSRPNNGLGSRQKYTKNPMPSSSRPNSVVVSSEKNRIFFSRSINVSVSWEKNAKKPVPSSSSPNNGGTSLSKHIQMSRPSPSRPNNDMISSPKDIEKSLPSSSCPNGGSVPSPKNIERFMSAESRPSRLRGGFSSRKPTFIGSNGNSNSTFSISNKPPSSLVHGHSSNVEMGTQVRLQPQTTKAACMGNMEQNAESMNVHVQLDSRKQNTALVSDGKANDGKYKSKMTEPLLEEKLGVHVDDDSAKEDSRPKKRMRDGTEQKLVGAQSGTAVITETAVMKDCPTEVSHHVVAESFKLQQYSSLPIDESVWSGIIKTQSKECVSLAAHLSTKYCDMVSKLSRSLPPMLEVTKLSRLEAWPKSFEASRPTDDNIALYFFPATTRQDEDGADPDQLVKEVVENDMVLRAVVDEAELLIFSSVLLPEQYKTFQGEPYLWGVFRPRNKKFATVDEQHGIGHCPQEEMGKQHAADHGVGKKGYMVAGLNVCAGLETQEEAEGQGMDQEQTPSVARPNTEIPVEDMVAGVNVGVGLETPEEAEGQGMEQEQTPSVARLNTPIPAEDMIAGLNVGVGLETPEEAEGRGREQQKTPSMARPNTPIPDEDTTRATSDPTMPSAVSANNVQGATSVPTVPAAMSANDDGQMHSSFSVPTGAIVGFVVRRTPRIEHLIEEMRREGSVVVAMRGEMIGSGLGQATATG